MALALRSASASLPVPEFTGPKTHYLILVVMTLNMHDFIMLGMAQFLDYDWDSDEDFQETSRQGREGLFFSFRRKVYFKKAYQFLEIGFQRFSFCFGKMSYHDEDENFCMSIGKLYYQEEG